MQNSEHKRERKVLPIKELDGGQGAWTLSPFKVTQARMAWKVGFPRGLWRGDQPSDELQSRALDPARRRVFRKDQ